MSSNSMDISGKKVFSGIVWNAIEKILQNGLSFVVKLILARILFPEDFGIIGMAVVFVGFIRVMGALGMNAALIQFKKENLYDEDYDTAFWAGIVWGIFLFIFVWLAVAPFATWFYNEPQLRAIIAVLGISLLLRPLVMVHEVDINRALNFKLLAFANNVSQVIGGSIAILMAYGGLGVWSLVFHPIFINAFRIPFLWKLNKWKPKFRFKKRSFKKIFGFGVYTTGTKVFSFFYSNVDYLLIGKFLGASSLGIYTLAYMLTEQVGGIIMGIFQKVMYPVYGRAQDNLDEIKKYFLRIVKYNFITISPLMGVLIIYSKDFLRIVFGEKWVPASAALQVLACSVIIHLLASSNTIVIRGIGKPKLEMQLQVFKVIFIFIPAISFGIYYGGILGASIAVLFNKSIAIVIAYIVLSKLINLKVAEAYQELYPLIGLFLLCTGTFYFLKTAVNFLPAVQAILYFVCIYSTYLACIPYLRHDLKKVYNSYLK